MAQAFAFFVKSRQYFDYFSFIQLYNNDNTDADNKYTSDLPVNIFITF